MNVDLMLATIAEMCFDLKRDRNIVNFSYREVPLILIFDENADRMRLISPIMEVKDLEPGMLLEAMTANFHSTLDARYGIYNHVVWSAFIHPLSDLSDGLLRSAIQQVAMARLTFGGEYTSGNLVFGGE